MDKKQLVSLEGDTLIRLVVCAAVGIGVVWAAEQLCEGKDIPLWKEYGPWITENRLRAAALLAAALYGLSLALWPEEEPREGPGEEYSPCP